MPSLCDHIILASHILTQNDTRDIIHNGAIVIDSGRIIAIGERKDILPRWAALKTSDLGYSLVTAGLINAHTHAAMTLLRGLADDLPLMEWLTKHIFPVEQGLSPELVELGTLLGCAEMARTGTTAFSDMYIIEDAAIKAAAQSGMRCLVGEGIFAFPSAAYANEDEAFALVREQIARCEKYPLITVAMAPHAVYTSNPDLLSHCAEFAKDNGMPIHMHLAETSTETSQCFEMFGKRPIPYAHDLGLLGPNTTLAHCVDLTDDEIATLASTNTVVAHNPKSNMKLSSGAARIPDMLNSGVCIALGTDGAASNNSLNMFSEMTSCALLHKVHTMDPTATPAQAVFDMATRNGARALHQSNIGTLQVGKQADIIGLDLNSPNLMPLYNEVSHLVYAASGHENKFTMVAGEVLYHDGVYSKIDMPLLRRELVKARDWALGRLKSL